MKFFSFSLLTISFVLVGFGLLKPQHSNRFSRSSQQQTSSVFNCAKFDGENIALKLNNRLCEYMDRSVKQGVKPSADKKGIQRMIRSGKLKLVSENQGYTLDTFNYSYAVLTPYAEKILNEIGAAFQDSLMNTPLAGTKLLVTSMTHTHYTVSKLVRRNRTAVRRSPHLNGNSFDFSFSRFIASKPLSECELHYLQQLSASILYHFKCDCKVWATFERHEECLHVVARMGK